MEIKPIHRIFASLVYNQRYVMEQVPEQDREAVQYVLDTEYSN
ncbi:MAG: hypothetical protein ACE3JQ_00210 [Paenisporosarcina sp.]